MTTEPILEGKATTCILSFMSGECLLKKSNSYLVLESEVFNRVFGNRDATNFDPLNPNPFIHSIVLKNFLHNLLGSFIFCYFRYSTSEHTSQTSNCNSRVYILEDIKYVDHVVYQKYPKLDLYCIHVHYLNTLLILITFGDTSSEYLSQFTYLINCTMEPSFSFLL